MAQLTQYTERGLREVAHGLVEAREVLSRRGQHLTAETARMDAELMALNKIASAVDTAIDIVRAEQTKREDAAKAGGETNERL